MNESKQKYIDSLISGPSESLNVEIKRWINPSTPEGTEKIVKASFAIRNRNGGYLLIGFDNKTLKPHLENTPDDVRDMFHIDKIQGVISKYASDKFEIDVCFGTRDGQEYPVIVIPEGIRVPVAAKKELRINDTKFLIKQGDVYFRTLESSGVPSTSIANYEDWSEIVNICFENREADFGRFLRRHLSAKDIANFIEDITNIKFSIEPSQTIKDSSKDLLDYGERRFQINVQERNLSTDELNIISSRGSWSVAFSVSPNIENATPNRDFLNTVTSANPRYTGWPVWLDSRGFRDQAAEPKVIDKAWEALIVSLNDGWFKHCDFMRLDPKGAFYLQRILEDDVTDKARPGEVLDPIIVILRVAEVIAVGLSFAKALTLPEETRLGFAFRWTKMKGRQIRAWANPMVFIFGSDPAHDDVIDTFVELPLDTPLSAIAPYVDEATRDLFVIFGGYTLSSNAIEDWTQRLIERRL